MQRRGKKRIEVRPSRQLDDPKPGYFKTKLVRGGPLVPAEIRFGQDPEAPDRSPLWEALINGKHVRTPSPDPVQAGVFRIWESATPISREEFRFLTDDTEWCLEHAPNDPQANPERRASTLSLPLNFFRPRARA